MVLGVEAEEGRRWPDMELSAGRIATAALRDSLPSKRRGDARADPAVRRTKG